MKTTLKAIFPSVLLLFSSCVSDTEKGESSYLAGIVGRYAQARSVNQQGNIEGAFEPGKDRSIQERFFGRVGKVLDLGAMAVIFEYK